MPTDLRQDAQAILSDPTFDVEGFVANINIHYQNRKIVKALGKSAAIVMGLVESGDYKFLEIMPNFIDTNIFKEMHDAGYDVWQNIKTYKWRNNSCWYGVKISSELALNFRQLGYQRRSTNTFEVVKGEGEVKKLEKKWKRLSLLPIGQEREVKILPIYKIRTDFRLYVHDTLGSRPNWNPGPKSSEFHYYNSEDHSYKYIKFCLLQSGKDHVRVKISSDPKCVLIKHNAKVKKNLKNFGGNIVDLGVKFKIDDPNLFIKIMDWVCKATTDGKEYKNASKIFKANLAKEIQKAGI